MKKPKLNIQEQITKLYQQGAQQELRMEVRRLVKEHIQEMDMPGTPQRTSVDPEQEMLDLGVFKDPDEAERMVKPWNKLEPWIQRELTKKGVKPESWDQGYDLFEREL